MSNKYGTLSEWLSNQNIEVICLDADIDTILAHSSKYHMFQCKYGHVFRQQPIHMTEGMLCPFCKGSKRISKPELCLWYVFRDSCKIVRQYRLKYNLRTPDKSFRPLSLDLFFPKFMLGVEYDGQLWHKDPMRDIKKDRAAFGEGITVLHIREPLCPYIPDDNYHVITKPVSDWKDMVEVVSIVDEVLGGGYANTDIELCWNSMLSDYYNGKKANSVKEWLDSHETDVWTSADIDTECVSMSDKRKFFWMCRRCGFVYDCTSYNIKSSKTGSRCPVCSGKIVSDKNSFAKIRPDLEAFYSVFNDVSFSELSKGSDEKRIWVCEEGHYFEASPSHLHGGKSTWCPVCSNNVILPGFNDLETVDSYLAEFVRLGGGDPSKIAKNDKQNRMMKCPHCGYKWTDSVLKRRPKVKLCPNCHATRDDLFK